MDVTIDIIYEDDAIFVCRKMPGIPVQAQAVGKQDMVSMLRNYSAKKGEGSGIYLVHRLDQPVEGIMVFARSKEAAASLSRQLQQKCMDKQYLALVEGIFPEPSGKLEDYLLRDGKSNTSTVVSPSQKGAKLARLHYKIQKTIKEPEELASFWAYVGNPAALPKGAAQPLSYISISLETGRHHQIRVQMSHAGHPLVGDKKYNKNCPSGYLPIGLCSTQISFSHPETGKTMVFSAEPKGILFSHPNFQLAEKNP